MQTPTKFHVAFLAPGAQMCSVLRGPNTIIVRADLAGQKGRLVTELTNDFVTVNTVSEKELLG
jgi:hypothetical protein